MVNLHGHEAGNGGHSQGEPKAYPTPLLGETRVESRTGAVAVAARWQLDGAFASPASIRFGLTLFPVPAHRTGLADFPHPALGKDSRFYPRKARGTVR
jgi:hypothetical protein